MEMDKVQVTVGRYSLSMMLGFRSTVCLMDSMDDTTEITVREVGTCSLADLKAWMQQRDAQVAEGLAQPAELPVGTPFALHTQTLREYADLLEGEDVFARSDRNDLAYLLRRMTGEVPA